MKRKTSYNIVCKATGSRLVYIFIYINIPIYLSFNLNQDTFNVTMSNSMSESKLFCSFSIAKKWPLGNI